MELSWGMQTLKTLIAGLSLMLFAGAAFADEKKAEQSKTEKKAAEAPAKPTLAYYFFDG